VHLPLPRPLSRGEGRKVLIMNEITENVRELRRRQTKAEAVLWKHVRNKKLGKTIVRQKPIIFYSGNYKMYFVADFFCMESKLIIEVDGKIHEHQKEYDKVRDTTLQNLGYRIIRIKNETIFNNLQAALKLITKNL
jgi:very-short-patch-repair endonuclease